MIHGDEADVAAEFEERARADALVAQRAIVQEDPDQDEQGNRYCLDCGEQIPAARVAAVNAVRCVDCARLRERGKPRNKGGAGIRRFLQPEGTQTVEEPAETDSLEGEL